MKCGLISPGESIAGFGYAVPYLETFLAGKKLVSSLSPAAQGAVVWPAEGPRRSMLVHDDMFPLEDESFDRIIEVHGLELIADADAHLSEIWRILKPEGRLLLVVPNRRGLWAGSDKTPFGNGRPYSLGQLQELVSAARLRPMRTGSVAHFAPFDTAFGIAAARGFERIGAKILPHFSGMLVVEAIKEMAEPVRGEAIKITASDVVRVPGKPAPA